MRYDPSQFSYGLELEFGDIERSLKIPEHLGSWEYAETDIVNLLPPYQYVAVDPLGIDPPVGGEINTVPGSLLDQVAKFSEILDFFARNDQHPTACCLSELHVHIHVPGLTKDILALKRLTAYTLCNQKDAIQLCGRYDERLLNGSKVSRAYLKLDIGRQMPQWMGDNIINKAKNFEDFIRIQCCGKDGMSRGRPIRYAINTYCLKHTQTVEFRLWRSTLDPVHVRECLRFVMFYMDVALNGKEIVPSVLELDRINRFRFPPFRYSKEECVGWEATKWDKSRGKKTRRYVRAGL